ncbi:unnamed protein product, partial [marine sediment metagenome]
MAGQRYIIEGGRRLEGTVRISGNKNAAVHAVTAALLTAEDCRLENLPAIEDVRYMLDILEALGVRVERRGSSLVLNAAQIHTFAAPS